MSINTRTGRDTTRLRAATTARLTTIRAQRFLLQNDPGPLDALDETLAYLDKCEDIGITPTACDLRRLIANALEVTP